MRLFQILPQRCRKYPWKHDENRGGASDAFLTIPGFRTTGGVMKTLRQNAPQSYTLKRLPRLLVRNAMMETPVRTNVVQSSARLSCHTC
jgi:hypothetical protein